MADSFVTFKDASNVTQNHDARTNSASTEVRPTVTIGNDGDAVGGVEQWGAQIVNMGPSTVFYDSWSTALDTTDKWTVTGTAPTITTGTMVMPATVSTYNALRSKDNIRSHAGFTYVANGITVETTTTTGAGRFWGLGTPATTPAAAVLVQDGIGFELDQATGSLLAVTYSNGVRTTVATLTRPTDGLIHRYALHFRVTQAYWYIDNLGVPVASQAFPNVTSVEVPAIMVRQNAASFTGSPVFTNTAHLTGDSSRQGQSIADPTIGTRFARVTPGGALSVSQNAPQTTGTAAGNIFRSRIVQASVTSSTVLVAAPATGLSIYLTDVSVSNAGSTLNTVSLLDGATNVMDVVAAATGGGGSMNFQTPIKCTAATALNYTTSAASQTFVTVTGYIAS